MPTNRILSYKDRAIKCTRRPPNRTRRDAEPLGSGAYALRARLIFDEIEQRGERIDAVKTEFRLRERIHVHRYLMGRRRTKTTAGNKKTYGMFMY